MWHWALNGIAVRRTQCAWSLATSNHIGLLHSFFVAVALCIAVGIAGCALFGPGDVHDAKIVSVEPLRLENVPGNAPFGNVPFDTPVFVVQFTTEIDLTNFARQGDNFYNRLLVGDEPCSGRPPKTLRYSQTAENLLSSFEVYDNAGHVVSAYARPAGDPPTADPATTAQDRIYHFYFGVRLPGQDDFFASYLEGRPETICFMLNAPATFGRSFKSNIVVIPRDVIVQAILRDRAR